jgi:hypothetical protein
MSHSCKPFFKEFIMLDRFDIKITCGGSSAFSHSSLAKLPNFPASIFNITSLHSSFQNPMQIRRQAVSCVECTLNCSPSASAKTHHIESTCHISQWPFACRKTQKLRRQFSNRPKQQGMRQCIVG